MVLCDNLDGWGGVGGGGMFKGEGTYVYLWPSHVHVLQKPTQYCKATKLRLKINLKKDEREILEVMDMFMA